MRVLQVDSGRAWRGGQNQVWLLCRELGREAGIEQALVTKQGSELAQRAAAGGVGVLGTAWDIGLDPRAWWHLRRTIAAFQPDVIHVHDSHALTLVATVAMGRKIVATRRVEFHIGRFGAWRRPDRIIAVSEAVKRVLIADGITSDAVVVVHDGIDVDEVRRAAAAPPPLDIRRQAGIPASAMIAVNAAALTGEKDHRTLIRAAHYARAMRPELHWVIAGEGKLREALAAEIQRLGLDDRVHLVGHIDRVDALIAEAGVFVLSSTREGLGSVVLNALALGRPVVATAAGGIPEILPPEVLVPVEGAEALAQRVVDVLDHPTPVPFPPGCSAGAMAQGVLDVYRALL
jgi:glycosyltransferase involved in cell wall biosynthesis